MRSLIATAVSAVASATVMNEIEFAFVQFIAKYGKNYSSKTEFNERLANFKFMNDEIMRLNSENSTTTHGHNKFSDMSRDEYTSMLGLKNQAAPKLHGLKHESNVAAPASVDWVAAGYVIPIQDQGQCGSCWAFSATAANESSYAINHGTAALYNLSEQQLVSCSSSFGNGGCNGGWYYYAWDYMIGTAQVSDSAYPYTSGNFGITGKCKAVTGGVVSTIGPSPADYVEVASNPASMQTAVAVKPNSVAIQADTTYFQSYTGGIMSGTACGTSIDHAVVIVGYGTSSTGVAYWTVRNSWGTGWGEAGYFQVAQSTGLGVCGINQYVAYPITN